MTSNGNGQSSETLKAGDVARLLGVYPKPLPDGRKQDPLMYIRHLHVVSPGSCACLGAVNVAPVFTFR